MGAVLARPVAVVLSARPRGMLALTGWAPSKLEGGGRAMDDWAAAAGAAGELPKAESSRIHHIVALTSATTIRAVRPHDRKANRFALIVWMSLLMVQVGADDSTNPQQASVQAGGRCARFVEFYY